MCRIDLLDEKFSLFAICTTSGGISMMAVANSRRFVQVSAVYSKENDDFSSENDLIANN